MSTIQEVRPRVAGCLTQLKCVERESQLARSPFKRTFADALVTAIRCDWVRVARSVASSRSNGGRYPYDAIPTENCPIQRNEMSMSIINGSGRI